MEASKEFKLAWRKQRDNIKVPEKDANNPHFRSEYRSWEVTEKALKDAGVKFHFVTVNHPDQAGVEWWVEIEGEEACVNVTLVDKAKRDPQASGGCFSYAMRYCVSTYLGWGIPDLDDDGNHATGLDSSFNVEEFGEVGQPVNQAPVADDKSTGNITAEQQATLLISTIQMQASTEALQEYWTNNHAEFTALMARDAQQYERAIQAFQAHGAQLKKELENERAV
jgi:hypothetical protein